MSGHQEPYSVPEQAGRVFHEAILHNHLIAKDLPSEIQTAASRIIFEGSTSPSIPVNWRLAEAVASLKGLEATLTGILVARRYVPKNEHHHHSYPSAIINTDHAQLFLLSWGLWVIDPQPDGLNMRVTRMRDSNPLLTRWFSDRDLYGSHASLYRSLATNIYRCADDRFFSLHGSFDPTQTLKFLGLPSESEIASLEEGVESFQVAVGALQSHEVQTRCDEALQAGTICYTTQEYKQTEHGQANQEIGLWEIYNQPSATQPAAWWQCVSETGIQRPLAGLKVVDLTRVIAGPTITRGLAELGASVMRCTSRNLPDVTSLLPDLSWGKWNCDIDITTEEGRENLRALILDADVVVLGYRPGSLEKYGFGQRDIIHMCRNRRQGVIAVRVNTYGWHGPWKDKSGWQQMSDACVGLSHGYGRAMGLQEPVTPILPHSDYGAGISGICAVLIALLRRGSQGGSYSIDTALNYYSKWLSEAVGEYLPDVFDKVWEEHGRVAWRSWQHNAITAPAMMQGLERGPGGGRLFQERFFEERLCPSTLGSLKMRQVRPIAVWEANTVQPGFTIGTRGNGVDAAHWPDNLSDETVK